MRPLLIASPFPEREDSCDRGRAGLVDGQPHPEAAAFAEDRFGADLAAHHVDHATGDRQPEAEAFLLAGLAAAVEALEDALALRRRDPGAGVDYLENYLCLAVMPGANRNGAGRRRVLEGV